MDDKEFFERIRADARPLRYEPDPVALSRIRARVRAGIERPTVTELLAAWFRPVLAAAGAIAVAAVIAFAAVDRTAEPELAESSVDIVMAGDSYSVGE